VVRTSRESRIRLGGVDAEVDPARIAGCRSYPGDVEIEIRAGFCDPDGELLAVLERSDWRRISNRRRGEIVDEMVRVCDGTERGNAEAWRRRDVGSAARGRPLATDAASLSL
jgi:hypothetical protein